MCELLGMSANVPTDICFSFKGLKERGGRTGPHKDGWGVAFYENKGVCTFKDALPSYQSEIARLVSDYPIKSCAVIAHVRQANRGRVALENTHPFSREFGCIARDAGAAHDIGAEAVTRIAPASAGAQGQAGAAAQQAQRAGHEEGASPCLVSGGQGVQIGLQSAVWSLIVVGHGGEGALALNVA